jgi:hypothetical protein
VRDVGAESQNLPARVFTASQDCVMSILRKSSGSFERKILTKQWRARSRRRWILAVKGHQAMLTAALRAFQEIKQTWSLIASSSVYYTFQLFAILVVHFSICFFCFPGFLPFETVLSAIWSCDTAWIFVGLEVLLLESCRRGLSSFYHCTRIHIEFEPSFKSLRA